VTQEVFVYDKCSSGDMTPEITTVPFSSRASAVTAWHGCKNSTLSREDTAASTQVTIWTACKRKANTFHLKTSRLTEMLFCTSFRWCSVLTPCGRVMTYHRLWRTRHLRLQGWCVFSSSSRSYCVVSICLRRSHTPQQYVSVRKSVLLISLCVV
jgi:hypothetical protein